MNEKILVVDDEASIVDLIKLELEFEGYQVETASDGVEAVEKALAIHPDLIVLDIMLPKKNGYDVCRELSPQLGVPIILLTAKTDIIDKVLGLELGADDYLTKPFDNRELLARIKAHLRRSNITIVPQKQE
nr:response regulator [Acetobacterium sp.]